jgi:hypothetical protein
MKAMDRNLPWFFGACLVGLGCAASPPARPEASRRIPDSMPERIAAQRAAAGNLQLEEEDNRWGIEAARERKRQQEEEAAAPVSVAPAPVAPAPAALAPALAVPAPAAVAAPIALPPAPVPAAPGQPAPGAAAAHP